MPIHSLFHGISAKTIEVRFFCGYAGEAMIVVILSQVATSGYHLSRADGQWVESKQHFNCFAAPPQLAMGSHCGLDLFV